MELASGCMEGHDEYASVSDMADIQARIRRTSDKATATLF